MTTTELQTRIERLTEKSTGVNRALERAKTNLSGALAQDAKKSDLTITIAGLRFAKLNLGTDVDHPLGRYYTHEEALEACPKGWRLPTRDEYKQLIERTTQKTNERDGILFTDKETGAEMYLPFAGGFGYNTQTIFGITLGYYWSSTCHPNSHYVFGPFYLGKYKASFLFLSNPNRVWTDEESCLTGFSVRCVRV